MSRRRSPLVLKAILAPLALAMSAYASNPASAQVLDTVSASPDLLVYVGEGCPHCGRALAWVDELRARQPELRVEIVDVVQDRSGLDELRRFAIELGLRGVSVPTIVVRGGARSDRLRVG